MAEAAEAVARLRLDATGFDKQANSSFREFSKQLTSVKDATDAAMRGAEALQKVFVKTLGGTIAIGAASALSDAMRDVGSKIGSAAQIAADAQNGIKGLAQSFEEGAARAEKLNAAAAGVAKSLEELQNASPVNAAIFRIFGGADVLENLQGSLRDAAESEMAMGAVNALRRSRMSPEQVRDFDLQAARQSQLDAASKITNEERRRRTVQALRERFASEDVEAQDKFFRETDPDRKAARAGFDGDLYDRQRDRARERMRAEFQAGLKEAQRQAEDMARARQTEEMNLNTMQIVEAQSALDEAEQRKKEVDRRVIETDAAAAKIAQGVFGSARGPGQRMTSMEIGINRAVDRAFNQQTIASSREYRDQIKAELGPGADAYKVNREIQKKREDQARQAARAPFEAAQAAKNQQSEIIKYMQSVQDILNELKAYAHAT
jgi:hypothetical protein